jgi:hypothetical protein
VPALISDSRQRTIRRTTIVTSTPSATSSSTVATDASIRPFQFHASDEALADLRRRIAATNWPDSELVTDPSQGVQLATMQKLARFWETDHDWRKIEARLNALPQFMTNIDGVDIHFIHVRSNEPNALPIIVTHGWPARTKDRQLTAKDELMTILTTPIPNTWEPVSGSQHSSGGSHRARRKHVMAMKASATCCAPRLRMARLRCGQGASGWGRCRRSPVRAGEAVHGT